MSNSNVKKRQKKLHKLLNKPVGVNPQWHCPLCQFIGLNPAAMRWTDLSREERGLLRSKGWSEKIYNPFMDFMDSNLVLEYAEPRIEERKDDGTWPHPKRHQAIK